MSASSQLINAKVSPKSLTNFNPSYVNAANSVNSARPNDQFQFATKKAFSRPLLLTGPSTLGNKKDGFSEQHSLLQRAGEHYHETVAKGMPQERCSNQVKLFAKDEQLRDTKLGEPYSAKDRCNEMSVPGISSECLKTSGTSKIQYHSQNSYSTNEPVIHVTKYFRLKQNNALLVKVPSDSRKKRINPSTTSGFPQSYYNTSCSNLKIPMIKEWFSELSIDERVLALSSVDKLVTDSIIRMQKKLNKHGNGKFSLETRIIPLRQLPSKVGSSQSNNQSGIIEQQQQPQLQIKQDYLFKQMNNFIDKDKDSLIQQTKLVHEKELMDFIRITDTLQQFDTITVSSALVAEPEKFFDLVSQIVGSNFLKIPYEITWDETRHYFITKSPQWFHPKNYNSLTAWIVYYLERALWVQYLQNVKGEIINGPQSFENNCIGNNVTASNIFLPVDGKFINIKNELLPYWNELHIKSLIEPKIMNDIENELLQRTYKQFQVYENVTLSKATVINRFNGGLDSCNNCSSQMEDNIKIAKQILGVLQREQDPQKFLQNLCMISLDRVENKEHIQMERILAEILSERSRNLLMINVTSTNKKLQKKKLKKKMKQSMMQKEHSYQDRTISSEHKISSVGPESILAKDEEEKEDLNDKPQLKQLA